LGKRGKNVPSSMVWREKTEAVESHSPQEMNKNLGTFGIKVERALFTGNVATIHPQALFCDLVVAV
jgi:hypothetical protein